MHSTPDRLTFLLHGRGDNINAYGVLQIASTALPRVKRLSIRALPPGAKLDDIQLDAATRQKTTDAISSKLTEYYVYPDVATKMIEDAQEHQKKGDYNSITDGNEFADALTHDLRDVSQDKHLFPLRREDDTSARALADRTNALLFIIDSKSSSVSEQKPHEGVRSLFVIYQ